MSVSVSKRSYEQAALAAMEECTSPVTTTDHENPVKQVRREPVANGRGIEMRERSLFAITVYRTKVVKQEAYTVLMACLPVLKLVIASEKNFDNEQVHHHIMLKTSVSFSLIEMRILISGTYGLPLASEKASDDQGRGQGETVWLGPVDSERNYLKYITKEDREPLVYGVSPACLSFQCQAVMWAKATANFSYADAFVLNHPQYWRLLENVYYDVKKEAEQMSLDEQYLRTYSYCRPAPTEIEAYPIFYSNQNQDRQHRDDPEVVAERSRRQLANNWRADVIDWWNEFVVSGHTHKKKQLYLLGAPDVGKTYFVNWLLRTCANTCRYNQELYADYVDYDERQPVPVTDRTQVTYSQFVQDRDNDSNNEFEQRVFRPTPNDPKYAWQDFDARAHNLLIADEISLPHQFDVSDFKKATAGEYLIANVKSRRAIKIRLKMPMIFISNHRPPADAANVGILERLYIVEALGSYKANAG